jgi:predicted MPP superfamily phosphohydrolase
MPYIIISCLALIIWVLIWINYGFKISPHVLEYRNLPKEFDGFRIALISDLHNATFGKSNRRLLGALKRIAPDAVALGGDMHTFSCDDEDYFAFLTELSKALPTYSVEGNHDWQKIEEKDRAPYINAYLATGVHDLNGKSVTLTRNGASIRFYGAPYGENTVNLGEKGSDVFSIALIHVPDWFDKIEDKPDLMLSGHVHGGIIQIPFVGGFLAPGYGATILERFGRRYFFPKYSKGVYSLGERRLAVSVGLGKASIQPFRFLRPEIMLITLKSSIKSQ